jgi:AcrR family transcriptional regulator
MPRITKSPDERRREIIETAHKCFEEAGFTQTQISDISKRMNTAQGLIYHYFKSKQELLYAVVDEMAASGHNNAFKNFGGKGNALERLNRIFENTPKFAPHGKLFESLKNDKALRDYCLAKMTQSVMPLLTRLIEDGNADGSWQCNYPRDTAIFILRGFFAEIAAERYFDNTDDETSCEPKTKEAHLKAAKQMVERLLGVHAK